LPGAVFYKDNAFQHSLCAGAKTDGQEFEIDQVTALPKYGRNGQILEFFAKPL
jgi:hypothetical protein